MKTSEQPEQNKKPTIWSKIGSSAIYMIAMDTLLCQNATKLAAPTFSVKVEPSPSYVLALRAKT